MHMPTAVTVVCSALSFIHCMRILTLLVGHRHSASLSFGATIFRGRAYIYAHVGNMAGETLQVSGV